MSTELFLKLQSLCDWFKQQDSVAVAYSGGVDSSLLLYIGTKVLGGKRCRGFFGDSCLIGGTARASALAFANQHNLTLQRFKLDPLADPRLVENSEKRCYICKKNTYGSFCAELKKSEVLLDGTNLDDLKMDRPGFQVLQELRVATPFLDCEISKFAIRSLSYHLGLSTWDKLSDSCLATRVKAGSPIVASTLLRLDQIGMELHHLGLEGCRVQIHGQELFLTVHTGQIKQTLNNDIFKQVKGIGKSYNFTKVFLDLFEREGILPSLLDYIGFEADTAPQKQFLGHFNDMSGFQPETKQQH